MMKGKGGRDGGIIIIGITKTGNIREIARKIT